MVATVQQMKNDLAEKQVQLADQIERTIELNDQLGKALETLNRHPKVVDGIQLASELGRLDIVSIMLACFGLLLGVMAIGGFWIIRGAAIQAARDQAKAEIDEKAASMFEEAIKTRDGGKDEPQLGVTESQAQAIVNDAKEVKEDE